MRVDQILRSHRGWVIAVSAALPPVACWLLSLARDTVANTTAALGLVLLVVAAAATGIRLAGIAAALTTAAGFDYFLTEPYHAFTIADPNDLETAVLLLLVGAAVSEIAIWGRRQQAHASREQGYLDGLLGTTGAVAAGQSSTNELIDLVRAQIVTLLHIDSCRFDPATEFGLPTLTDDGTLIRGRHSVDITRKGLPTDTAIALKIAAAAPSTATSCSPPPPA